MRKMQACLLGGALLLSSVAPVAAQDQRRENQDRGNSSYQNRGNNNRGNNQSRSNYYGGMNDHVRGGNYEQSIRRDEDQHHHDDRGGIGPGKAALIGGAGGAALGAIFGGGLKGTLIGGAAGAGIGAIGGKLAEGHDDHRDRGRD